jgi:hypothetical protein
LDAGGFLVIKVVLDEFLLNLPVQEAHKCGNALSPLVVVLHVDLVTLFESLKRLSQLQLLQLDFTYFLQHFGRLKTAATDLQLSDLECLFETVKCF